MRPLAPVYIAVNGILTLPGSSRAWTDRATTWFHSESRALIQAEKFEYFATPLTRRLRQHAHARDLADLIRSYAGRRIHLIGHSNGCDLILRALALDSTPLASIHLIAAACDEDFNRNGLNNALLFDQLGAVHVYTSPDDAALKWAARPSRALLGWLGLGYGILGLVGPQRVLEYADQRHLVHRYDRPGFGHSTWFADPHFDATLNLVLHNDRYL